MSGLESHPQRNRKPSNHLLHAQGKQTDSDSDDNDDFAPAQDNTDDDGDIQSSSVAPAPPTSSAPLSIQRTQSTTSVVSQTSVITTARTEDDKRRARFDERFQTATSTEEEVLRMFS